VNQSILKGNFRTAIKPWDLDIGQTYEGNRIENPEITSSIGGQFTFDKSSQTTQWKKNENILN
jgi:hypothetical protein